MSGAQPDHSGRTQMLRKMLRLILMLALATCTLETSAAQTTEISASHTERTRTKEAVKWTDEAQLVVTVLGFVLVVFQLRGLRRQVEGDTHADLYGQYMELGKLFLSKP